MSKIAHTRHHSIWAYLAICLIAAGSMTSCASSERRSKSQPKPEASATRPDPAQWVSVEDLARRHGYTIERESAANLVRMRKGDQVVRIRRDTRVAFYNDDLHLMDSKPVQFGDRTYVARSTTKDFDRLETELKRKKSAIRKVPKVGTTHTVRDFGLRGQRFVIDAGHGGKDPGTGHGSKHEKHIVLNIARDIERMLKAEGAEVLMTRTNDHFIELGRRAEISNAFRPDAFISVHVNAAENNKAEGVEVFRPRSRQNGHTKYKINRSVTLAHMVYNRLSSITPARDRGVKMKDFRVLKRSAFPAILVETGFISNARERRLLLSRDYQQRIAKGIVEALRDYSRRYDS